ncbi:Hypothetical predicted protein, partial [Paramuricea clavata]
EEKFLRLTREELHHELLIEIDESEDENAESIPPEAKDRSCRMLQEKGNRQSQTRERKNPAVLVKIGNAPTRLVPVTLMETDEVAGTVSELSIESSEYCSEPDSDDDQIQPVMVINTDENESTGSLSREEFDFMDNNQSIVSDEPINRKGCLLYIDRNA